MLPVTAIVLLISVFLVPVELGSIVMFITGAAKGLVMSLPVDDVTGF